MQQNDSLADGLGGAIAGRPTAAEAQGAEITLAATAAAAAAEAIRETVILLTLSLHPY